MVWFVMLLEAKTKSETVEYLFTSKSWFVENKYKRDFS